MTFRLLVIKFFKNEIISAPNRICGQNYADCFLLVPLCLQTPLVMPLFCVCVCHPTSLCCSRIVQLHIEFKGHKPQLLITCCPLLSV